MAENLAQEDDFVSEHVQKESSKGRQDNRHVKVFKVSPGMLAPCWAAIIQIVMVRRYGIRQGKAYDFVHYYATNLQDSRADAFGKLIRSYWRIENELHRNKDVVLGEDAMTIHQANGAGKLAAFNSLALNLLKLAGISPNKDGMMKLKSNIKLLLDIVR